MPVRFQHLSQSNTIYFISFTCYQWIHLFSITNAYDTVFKWFDYLYENNHRILGYVIMPNHVHVLLFSKSDEEQNERNKMKTVPNSTYPKVAVQWLNQALCFYQSLCWVDSEVLRNRHLRVAANRYV